MMPIHALHSERVERLKAQEARYVKEREVHEERSKVVGPER